MASGQEQLDLDFSLEIRPYQFEPIAAQSQDGSDSETDSDNDDDHDDNDYNQDRRGNTDWCECGGCMPMTTGRESKCCREVDIIDNICQEEEIECVTEYHSFRVNCLDRDVIHVSMLEFFQYEGPVDADQPIDETYRYVSYRRFARLIWQRLPKKMRKILPACVVRQIREAFPNTRAGYTGFKYAE